MSITRLRRRAPLNRKLVSILWLAAVWVALWGDLSVANVAGGLVVGTTVTVLIPVRRARRAATASPVAVLRLVGVFAWKLVEASAVVAWEVVTPGSRINRGIVAVPIRGVSEGITTLVANMISLTPGTITIEVRSQPTTLYIHVLHLRDVEEVRSDVRRLEELAIAAFAPELVEVPMPTGGEEGS